MVCAERAKLGVRWRRRKQRRNFVPPKKERSRHISKSCSKTVVFERVHLGPSGAYKSVTYRLRRPEVFEPPARAGSCYKVAQSARNLTFKCPILSELTGILRGFSCIYLRIREAARTLNVSRLTPNNNRPISGRECPCRRNSLTAAASFQKPDSRPA